MFELDPARQTAFADALLRLSQPECLAVSIPFFTKEEIAALTGTANALPMRKARPLVGKPGMEVVQDFDICFPAPRVGAMEDLAALLEGAVNASGQVPSLVAGQEAETAAFLLNDVAVQRYPAGSAGIGPHRDALRYRGLVFIITLDGTSRLCTCRDRDGTGAEALDDQPGMLAILSAPGFAGREGEGARALHFVDQVTGGRLSIGLRHDSKAVA